MAAVLWWAYHFKDGTVIVNRGMDEDELRRETIVHGALIKKVRF